MPMYEFRCQACSEQVVTEDREAEAHLSPDHVSPCGPLKRVWSVGFQIKSTDWSHD